VEKEIIRLGNQIMKKIIGILSLSTALGCVLLTGCSKSNDSAPAANGASKPSAASASSGSTAAPAGPVEMKLKWTAGKRYLQEMTMSQTSEITVPGTPAPMQQEMEMNQGFAVSALKTLPDGGTELEMKFTSEKMSNKVNGRDVMNFDSSEDASKDGGNPAATIMRKIVGAHVKFLTDADGKIDKVEGFQEFIDSLTGGSQPQMKAMIQGMFNEESLKQFGSGSMGLPGKPVKVGDTWPFEKDITAGPLGKMNMKLKFKFAGWEQHADHNCVLLTYTGDMSSKGAPAPGAMTMNVQNGKVDGKTWFDPELGMMVENTGDQTMTINMTMQGKKMTSKTKQKIGIKLVEIQDMPK
jgi:hypothetical protein